MPHDSTTQQDRRHLRAVPSLPSPEPLPASPDWLPDGPPAPPVPPRAPRRVNLTPWQRMEVEQARELADSLADADAADLTPVRLAFVLGRLHGAASNLLDVLDAITEL